MCGIVGKLGNSPELKQVVQEMCKSMAHRGPDNQGVVQLDDICLGHRRLSIIDLSAAANQPMCNYDKRYYIVYNGEIYNHNEIRKRLKAEGYIFRTHSDTETLLTAYEAYGKHCLQYLNGMFAFAIWDTEEKKLFMARDRFGEKPLYYYSDSKSNFSFASELKAFKKDKTIHLTYSYEALNCYLALGYILNPMSQYREISMLEPAHYIIINKEGRIIKKECYWDYADTFNYKRRNTEDIVLLELREFIKNSVHSRMLSDVPVGAFLSGGIDSSSVVAMMKKKHNDDLHTFSVGFAALSYNELPDADRTADYLGTIHHRMSLDEEYRNDGAIKSVVDLFDEFFSDNSLIPMVKVSKLASQYVKVVLSGDGADELFGGYITYKADKLLPIFKSTIPLILRKALAKNQKINTSKKIGMQYKRQQFFYGSLFPYDKAHYLWRIIFHPEDRIKILGEEYRKLVYETDPFIYFRKYYEQVNHLDKLDQHLYVDAMTWLTDDILLKVDRSSMLSSLEARAPFLDHELASYVASLDSKFKVKGLTTKYIMKNALHGIIPDFVLNKKKSGFNSPINQWINYTEKNEFQGFCKYVYDLKYDISGKSKRS